MNVKQELICVTHSHRQVTSDISGQRRRCRQATEWAPVAADGSD